MTNQELDFVIEQGEGQFIEFKEKVDKSLSKGIVAFANAQGGRIYVEKMGTGTKRMQDSMLRQYPHSKRIVSAIIEAMSIAML